MIHKRILKKFKRGYNIKSHPILYVLIGTILLNVILIPILPTTVGYGLDTDLSTVDASFHGEKVSDYAGYVVSNVGDVNGDNFDDLMINAKQSGDNGANSGQSYLIFGSSTGWKRDESLSNSDASFWGEHEDDWSGCAISGNGDINGDGYDDMIIGAWGNGALGNKIGEVHIILGKSSGWNMDTKLSLDDGSFVGDDSYDYLGKAAEIVGDVNGDGLDDMLLGAPGDEDGGLGAGQTYLVFGKKTTWNNHVDISNADASFIGENAFDESGASLSGVGDLNGDGYDDFIIGAYKNDDTDTDAGKIYLFFGKPDGWKMDIDLSEANATFLGEKSNDWAGKSLGGAGDVNGDGYDDMIIGAYFSDVGGSFDAGQVYLILGKETGWSKDINLGAVDASFWGEHQDDSFGGSLSGAGDVNGDGFDDFIASSPNSYEGASNGGQTYLILGKSTGWKMDADLSTANASFLGEEVFDQSGYAIAGGGDHNGDGYDDIIIGAHLNDEAASAAGQTYLIFPFKNTKPSAIEHVKFFVDESFNTESDDVFPDDSLFIELKGTDGDPTEINVAEVSISSDITDPKGFDIRLIETDKNTGVYRGDAQINIISHESHGWIGANIGETITVKSKKNPSKLDTVKVVPLRAKFYGPILTNGDGESNDTLFSKYKPYNFKFDVKRTDGLDFIKSFSFELDTGESYKWHASSKLFESINNKGYTILDSSSSFSEIGDNNGILNFNITFNWTNTKTGLMHNIKLTTIDSDDDLHELNDNINYYLNNKLEFTGNLTVTGDIQGSLESGSVVRTNEELTWTGLKVVYTDTEDIYPHDNEFDVKISDDDGGIWFDNNSHGEEIDINTVSDSISDQYEYYTIEIIGPPENSVNEKISYSLIIDGEDISFLGLEPDNNTWQTELNPTFQINVIDEGGGLVDPDSIDYRNSINDGGTWTQWKEAVTNSTESMLMITVTANPEFKEGTRNLLQWRGMDSVTNGYNNSEEYRIKIDTQSVIFSESSPISSQVQNSTEVICGIQIFDELSGVKGQSIEYAISTDNKLTWSDWRSAYIDFDNNTIKCSVKVIFENGTSNYIKWRSSDVAGNELTESAEYQIRIDITIPDRAPKVILSAPLNNTIINKNEVTLFWQLTNSDLSNTKFKLYYGTDPNLESPFITDIETTNYHINNLADGETYYWMIIPVLSDGIEGTCLSGIWNFIVDLDAPDPPPPYKIGISGTEYAVLSQGENKSIILSITNLGLTADLIELRINSPALRAYAELNDYKPLNLNSKESDDRILTITAPLEMRPGIYEVNVTAVSLNSGETVKAYHIIKIEIKEKDDKEVTKESSWLESNNILLYLLLIIIVIVTIITVLFFLFIKPRMGGKEPPEEPPKEELQKSAEAEQKAYDSQQDQYQAMYGETPQPPPQQPPPQQPPPQQPPTQQPPPQQPQSSQQEQQRYPPGQ